MPCYRPLLAWQCADGGITFVERRKYDVVRELQLPCGQCIGCRLERSRQWAMRCLHEASLYGDNNSFITLTYEEANLPPNGLDHEDFQKFMRRLRKEAAPQRIRFYMCGEYGEQLLRPHFHACLFNCSFIDQEIWATSETGMDIYRSKTLERLWPKGFSTVAPVTFETAAYTARYCMKKITGHNAKYWYGEKKPEYNAMSLKPGIGKRFLEKWEMDIYPRDYVIINGVKTKPPKYYDKVFKDKDPDAFEEMQQKRELEGRSRYEDNTERRLKDKEEVTKARVRNLKRRLINADDGN